MLTGNCRITVSREGQEKLISDLMIGEEVFVPMLAQPLEIIDVLSRKVRLDAQIEKTLRPVQITKHAITRTSPSQDLIVTPEQVILAPQVRTTSTIPIVERVHARELGQYLDCSFDDTVVEFFAIFLAHRHMMRVNQTLVESYVLDDIT